MTQDAPDPRKRPQLAVSAAIFRDDGRLLLVRRAREPGRGLYSFPGGRVEHGETLEAALRREVTEETRLTVEIVGLAGWREILPTETSSRHYVVLSFAARWGGGEVVLNDELDDVRWVLPGSAFDGLRVTEGLAAIAAAARDLIAT